MKSAHSRQNNDPNSLFHEACRLHELKKYQDSELLYRKIIELFPGSWLIHYNLGLLYFEQGHFFKALTQYQHAVGLNNASNDLFFNLAICQKNCGLIDEAITSYRRAITLDPEDTDSHYNLAGCYASMDLYDKAIHSYRDVLRINPGHQSALNNLAYLYHKIGDKKNAVKTYSELLTHNPAHEAAAHMLAALTGITKKSAPSSYVKDVFDQYSDHYEESLVGKLQYRLPETLKIFIDSISRTTRFSRILDLGCGTGLCGDVFVNTSDHIDGIDLSPNMIARAREKGIYTSLHIGDINETLQELSPASYALILAADVFSYIGDLETVFKRARTVSEDGGFLFFSVEHLPDKRSSYLIQDSGRFAHSPEYIVETALQNGWELIGKDAIQLRKERGSWIKGMIYGLKAVVST